VRAVPDPQAAENCFSLDVQAGTHVVMADPERNEFWVR
jgi:hypothetical protein